MNDYTSFDDAKERREAIEAGERAKISLQNALNELNSAGDWGIFDLLGGGMISSLIKHSKMDKAAEYIEEAKRNLRAFSRELADMEEYANIDVSTGDFWGFADWFFDGFLSDWMIQKRIREAQSQVQQAIDKVNSILYKLRYGKS